MDSQNCKLPIQDEEDEKLKIFLDRYSPNMAIQEYISEGHSQDNEQFSVPSSPVNKKCPTNPFLSPSLPDADIDSQFFLENLLKVNQSLISSNEETNHSKRCSTNPFLNNTPKNESLEEACVNNSVVSSSSILESSSDVTTGHQESKSCNVYVNNSSLERNEECAIKNYFDMRNWKADEFIPLRVSNTYHLNRFWIVPRYRELELFMEFLASYYSKNKSTLKVKQIVLNLYCVVSYNNLFYRAIIVSFIPNDPHRVKVFLFDYGMISLVFNDDIYFLQEKLYSVPQFAVRASLAYICPRNKQTWTSDAVKRFEEFVANKVLIGKIFNVDVRMKALKLIIGEIPSDGFNVNYINKLLIDERYAKYIFDKRESEASEYQLKVKHLYLFPSFQEIETGKVASTVTHFEVLKNTVALDVLYNQYCTL